MNNDDIYSIPLVDQGAIAEGCLEKHLAACLVLFPLETLSLCEGLKLRVNTRAKKFWNKVQLYKDEILNSTEDEAISLIDNILLDENCINDFPEWHRELHKADLIAGVNKSINRVDRIINIRADLEATRGVSIWIQRVQDQHLFEKPFTGV